MTLWLVLLVVVGLAYCACCCQPCEGPTCCGGEYPGLVGFCCDDVWRTDGICCGGQWYPPGDPGVCCDNVWQTGPGVCCDGVWQTDPGVCCGGVWYPEGTPGQCCEDVWHTDGGTCCQATLASGGVVETWCPEGNHICGDLCCCVPDDYECEDYSCCPLPPHPKEAPPWGGAKVSKGMCCTDGVCSMVFPWECDGYFFEECLTCEKDGCPVSCCEELPAGDTQCGSEYEKRCGAPKVKGESCDIACLGECCIDGVSQGQKTKADCDAIEGEWGGLGSTSCPDLCRAPFDSTCCETATSGGYGLTFTQPFLRRNPPFTGTMKAVVTGTTDSPILVHGTPVGSGPTKRCGFSVEVLLCGDSFNIEPVPCGSRFRNLDVTVCWSEETVEAETLKFSGCNNITVWLGRCERSCFTTLVYAGPGHTSNANIILYGDAIIEANGSGPLVLTSPITQQGDACNSTLTLTGTSTALNHISGVINDRPGGSTQVQKTGVGVWKLSGVNEFSGQFTLRQGTLIVGADVSSVANSPSPVGTASNPLVGDPAVAGQAVLLMADGVTMSRDFTVDAPAVVGGLGISSYSSSQITLNANVTLQAAATTTFNNQWTSASVRTITFGTSDNTGTVVLNQGLGYDWPIIVDFGTAKMGASDVISSSAVTVNAGTLDVNGTSQTVPSLTLGSSGGTVTGGTLTLGYSGTASVYVAGTGHEISAALALALASTFTVDSGAELLVSGVMSGAYQITKTGSGVLRLSGVNTYSGGTIINGGTVRAEDVSAFGTNAITVNPGGTLDKNGYAIANVVYNNGGTVIP